MTNIGDHVDGDAIDQAFERHFAIIVSGSERTRGVLYFLLITIVVNFVFFFADAFDTAGLRMDIMNGANVCLAQKLGRTDKVPLSGDIYTRHETCDFFYDYIHDYYMIDTSGLPQLGKAAEMAFNEKYKASLRDATDDLSTTVPILNIKIDRNDGLILQNTLAAIVISILIISLMAERKSLVTAEQAAGADYFKLKAISDIHVFNRASGGRAFFIMAIFAPVFLQAYRIGQDLQEHKVATDLYGPGWGTAYLALECVSLVVVFGIGLRCFFEARLLNDQLNRLEQRIQIPESGVPHVL